MDKNWDDIEEMGSNNLYGYTISSEAARELKSGDMKRAYEEIKEHNLKYTLASLESFNLDQLRKIQDELNKAIKNKINKKS